jgi:hypothetical protein
MKQFQIRLEQEKTRLQFEVYRLEKLQGTKEVAKQQTH